MKTIVSVVGARPQFIKLAPVSRALQRAGARHVVVHTGQHYDPAMSSVFFDGFELDEPDYQLNVGSASHALQTAMILERIEGVLAEVSPDWTLVYGDTNSTLAACLAAVKMNLRVAHLEAGLRSRNRGMPEEHNRVLTDHASDLLLAPTPQALSNLEREGLGDRSTLVGDVMADICLETARQVQAIPPPLPAALSGDYALCTLHRPSNTDDALRLKHLVETLSQSPVPIVIAAHPRLLNRAEAFGIRLDVGQLRIIEPLSYPELIWAVINSKGVITDSGGLQKECFILGRPCTTVRAETEWDETLAQGWNQLVGDRVELILEYVARDQPAARPPNPFGDGTASLRVAALLAGEGMLP